MMLSPQQFQERENRIMSAILDKINEIKDRTDITGICRMYVDCYSSEIEFAVWKIKGFATYCTCVRIRPDLLLVVHPL
jgi:hypothetical protein